MRSAAIRNTEVNGKAVEYRLVRSRSARRLRVRVGLDGVEVVQPAGRDSAEADAFLAKHHVWIASQLERVARLRVRREPRRDPTGEMLFRGVPTPVRVEIVAGWRGPNRVSLDAGVLRIVRGADARTSVARSLENWLRKQVRAIITQELGPVTRKVKRTPNCVYVMGQRTKWGNCSAMQNLSFSWRLIMVPDHVLRYLVTHEVVHLAVPDHSARFWLTVQSLCVETGRAKQWLARYGRSLPLGLEAVVGEASL